MTNFLSLRNSPLSTLNALNLSYSTLTGSTITTNKIVYSTLTGSSISGTTIATNTATVQSTTTVSSLTASGVLGIGTATAATALTVQLLPIATATGPAAFSGIHIQPTSNTGYDSYYNGITWSGNNSGLYGTHAGIHVQGGSAFGTKMYFRTTNNWSTGLNSSPIVIDNVGNLGIGTASPASRLHLHAPTGATEVRINLTDGTTGATANSGVALIKNASENFYLWNYAAGSMTFGTNNIEAMTINTSGQVGIGTASPVSMLTIWNQITPNTSPNLSLVGYSTSPGTGPGINFYCWISAITPQSRIEAYDDNNYGSWLTFSTKINGDGSNLLRESLRLGGPSGFVGIGTANPSATLDVNGFTRLGGNVGIRVHKFSGTHPAINVSQSISLPAGVNNTNIILVIGYTVSAGNDLVPWDYRGDSNWIVGYYISINVIYKTVLSIDPAGKLFHGTVIYTN